MPDSWVKTWAGLVLLAAIVVPSCGALARTSRHLAPPRRAPGFGYADVIALARRLAALPYAPPRGRLPAWMRDLTPGQYRAIQFDQAADPWLRSRSRFRLEPLPAGFAFRTPVAVSTVRDGKVVDLRALAAMFRFDDAMRRPAPGLPVPLSGFCLQTPLEPRRWQDFLAFQGATYFRAIARDEVYGLSARGLAIDTAEPSGEEVPAFTHFWVEEPGPRATGVVIEALLESRSATGAYRFVVQPGVATVMDVEATLFPRREIRNYGLAPLTSMFLFDETNRGIMDDYRPEVHDSDGLQITTNTGEHVWRPLANPAKLQISAFTTQAPQGFGLVQRSRRQSDFEDLGASYERRPSAWIEPEQGFGAGAVELIEIPSGRETNDNIVAFFQPDHPLQPGHPAHLRYRLTWLAEPALPHGLAEVVATRSGASIDGKRRVFEIDFVGAGDRVAGMHLDLSASSGTLSNVMLQPNPAIHGFRASFELSPKRADLVELRLQVTRAGRPISETWLYRWTPR